MISGIFNCYEITSFTDVLMNAYGSGVNDHRDTLDW